MKRLLSIWLPNWPIQRLRSGLGRTDCQNHLSSEAPDLNLAAAIPAGQPEPKRMGLWEGRPIVLWQLEPHGGKRVVACCEQAAESGVRCGVAIAQATELLIAASERAAKSEAARGEKTPARTRSAEPIILEHDPIADSLALANIADAMQERISPMVAIENRDPRVWAGEPSTHADTLFCDLSGVTHLFSDERGILVETHRCLGVLGVQGKLAIAGNPAAAWAHAHYNARADFMSDDTETDLRDLSVCALRIGTDTHYTLQRLGIDSIGALLQLPRSGLAPRLGKPLVQRIAECVGDVEMPLAAHRPERCHQATMALEYPTDDFEIIADRVERLVKELVASLATSQRGALRLACRLDLEGHSQLETVIGLFAPTLQQIHLKDLINASIESRRLPAPVNRISLRVLQSGLLRTTQTDLFGESEDAFQSSRATDVALARLIDQLSGRLGRHAVLGVSPADDPLPERAYRTFSLTDHRARAAVKRQRRKRDRQSFSQGALTQAANASNRHHPLRLPHRDDAGRRPLKLLRQPVPLETQGTAGGQTESLPTFRLRGESHKVLRYWGPERIETGWWYGPAVRRDYFRIETDRGHRLWVFRDLSDENESWYLHGRYV